MTKIQNDTEVKKNFQPPIKTILCLCMVIAVTVAFRFATGTPSTNAQQRPVQQRQPTTQSRPAPNQVARQAAPTQQAAGTPQTQTISVVAVVNNEKITRDQLSRECLKRFGNDLLERLVNKHLILAETQKRGIVVTNKEINDEVTKVASRFRIPADQYLAMLETQKNVTADQYKREIIWPTLALKKLSADQIKIDPNEVAKRFEAEFGEQVQVRVIMLNDQQKAQQVLAAARKAPDQFGTLAKDHSVDPVSAPTRGMVPVIRKHVGDPTIEKIAFGLQAGQISDVVQLQNAFWIIKCVKHFPAQNVTPEQKPLIEQRIVDELSEKKLAEVSSQLFKTLQNQTQVVNVYNDPQLRAKYPGVAAQVGKSQITVRELSEECIARHGVEVLEGEINRALLNQQLLRNRTTVEKGDIDAEIARAADAMGSLKPDGTVDIDSWIKYVTEEGKVSVDLYIQDVVWPSVALKKLVGSQVQVTQQDLDKSFEANFGTRVEVLACVLPNDRQARKVWNLANQNPTDEYFGNLANAYSIEPESKANFGRVAPIKRNGGRSKMEEEAFKLKPGELSGIINVGQNWVVLRCIGHTKPRVRKEDFAKVKDTLYKDIHEKKMRMAMNTMFERIREASQIDNFLAGTTQVGAKVSTGQVNQRQAEAIKSRLPFGQARK